MPERRWHYRDTAAALAWEVAEMRPRNDVLGAEALYCGGVWLKGRGAGEADRFYKALVRRHPNLLIVRQADELRWFPREFTDVVLYEERADPWYTPIRGPLLRFMETGGLIGLLAWTAWWLWRRLRPALPTS